MTQAFNLSQLANGVNTSGQLDIANYVTGTLPTANLPTIPVANGGTGQTTYTNGQLLIGNTTGNTLTKATLTAGTNITITNGNGSITIAASGGAPTTAQVQSAMAGSAAGDLGTFAFLQYDTTGTTSFGTNRAGNVLYASNAFGTTSYPSGLQTGTWKCVGYTDATSSPMSHQTTAWLRVA